MKHALNGIVSWEALVTRCVIDDSKLVINAERCSDSKFLLL